MLPIRPLLLGHRGSPRDFPENTLASFRRALELGADGVEFDVRGNYEHLPIVMHDPTLERMCGDPRRVHEVHVSDLRSIRIQQHFPVPTLTAVSLWAMESGAWLNVELKAAGIETSVLSTLRRFQVLQRSFCSSFDPSIVHRIRTLDASATAFLVAESWDPAIRDAVQSCNAMGICLASDAINEEVMLELKSLNLPCVVWTVNDLVRMQEHLAMGVRGIISDYPELFPKLRSTWTH